MKTHISISKNLSLLFTLLLFFVFFSCSDDDEPAAIELFEGSWSGTYSGTGDNGTWGAIIDENGNISGIANSTVLGMGFGLSGTVNSEGEFHATAGSATSGTLFTGTLTATSGQGTWENAESGFSGTWTGAKE